MCSSGRFRPQALFRIGDVVWAGRYGVGLYLLGRWHTIPLRGEITGLSFLEAAGEWFYDLKLVLGGEDCRFPEHGLSVVSLLDRVAEAAQDS